MQILSYKLEAIVGFNEESIEQFLTLCEDIIYKMTADERVRYKVKSAVHELVINSLEHGYKMKSGKISFSIRKAGDSLIIEFCDEGHGLDSSCINLGREIFDIESAPSRGWGLAITNKLFNKMEITPNKPSGTKISITIFT